MQRNGEYSPKLSIMQEVYSIAFTAIMLIQAIRTVFNIQTMTTPVSYTIQGQRSLTSVYDDVISSI